MEEPVVALVVAAGSGIRLGAELPKALVPLEGVSLLRRSIDALTAGGVSHLVVVVPSNERAAFEADLSHVQVPVLVTDGGMRRQDSVARGLDAAAHWRQAAGHRIVLVHDAARPLVPRRVTERVIEAVAAGAEAVVPAIAVVDSIRQLADHGSSVVDRALLRAVQTPQGFNADLLRRAHAALAVGDAEVSDDAAACELIGATVTVVEGSSDSLKVTTPSDLVLAAAVLHHRDRDVKETR